MTGYSTSFKHLKSIVNRFGETEVAAQISILRSASRSPVTLSNKLAVYHDLLLFVCSHPANKMTLRLAERELRRISYLIRKQIKGNNNFLLNSGLPFTVSNTGFSHDCIRWLLALKDCSVVIDSYKNEMHSLNDVLRLTLPSVEISETTAGHSNDNLLNALLVNNKRRLPFIVSELERFDNLPFVKDLLFDSLGIYVNVSGKNKSFSRTYNRISVPEIFYHSELLKKFNHSELISSPLPESSALSPNDSSIVADVIKKTMVLTQRETDTSVYMEPQSLRLYHLERGISVAIYGMIPERQLPLESYVGYTLFKNGFPAAYGGAWVFGQYANFGINIFEAFRGGESGFVLCQLLRVFRQVFNVQYFEIEPYQYGLDNPEGIQTGAFWFYYRYGFRPVDRTLNTVAKKEFLRLQKIKGSKTPEKILLRFTESNIALKLGSTTPIKVSSFTSAISNLIARKFNGSRHLAEENCIATFKSLSGVREPLNTQEQQVLTEVALWAAVLPNQNKKNTNLLKQMIFTKPKDLYAYQKLLLELLR